MLNHKKVIIHRKNTDKCFHCIIKVKLNHEQIKRDLQIVTKIFPFIDQIERKTFETNNKSIARIVCSFHTFQNITQK